MDVNLDEFQMLSWATGDMLTSHGNTAYLELVRKNEILRQEKESLWQEKIELQMTVKATEKLLDCMTESRSQTPGQSNACETPSALVNQPNVPISSREMPPPLQQENYPDVRFWTRHAYTRWSMEKKGITDGLSQQQTKRGRPSKTARENEDHHPYIEDANGKPVNDERIYNIGKKARRLWNSLDEWGIAPTTSTGMSESAYGYYSKEMLNDFIEFRLASGTWKLDFWTSKNYSSWYQWKTKQNKRKRNDTVSSTLGSTSRSSNAPSSSTSHTTNSSRANSDDGSLTNGNSSSHANGDDSSPPPDNGSSPGDGDDSSHTNGNESPRANSDGSSPGDGYGSSHTNGNDSSCPNGDDSSLTNGNSSSHANGDDSSPPPDNGSSPSNGDDSSHASGNGPSPGNGDGSSGSHANGNGSGTGQHTRGPRRVTLNIRKPGEDMSTSNRSDKEVDDAPMDGGGERNNEEEESRSKQGPSTEAGRPSKRAKVLVAGVRNTAKNIARRQWIEANPGGLEANFETFYKSQQKKPGSGETSAAAKAKAKATQAKSRQKVVAAAMFASGL